MSKAKENTGINISVKSFITAIVVIFALMVLTYGLTFVIPGGGIPFWKWALSPILVLGAEGNASLIAVIVFLLVIGGIFNCLDKCGLMQYMLDTITDKFGKDKYKLLALVTLFFVLRSVVTKRKSTEPKSSAKILFCEIQLNLCRRG